MAQWFPFGLPAKVKIEFLVEGVPVIPAAVLALVITDETGTKDLASLTVPPDTSSPLVEVPSSALMPLEGQEIESRVVYGQFTYDGSFYTLKQTFRIHPWVTLVVTPQDVRALLGVDYEELPDEDIDLMGAYFSISPRLADPSGLTESRLLLVKAALDASYGFELRFQQTRRSEDATTVRQKIDFTALRTTLASEYDRLMTEVNTQTVVTSIPLISLTNPTDIITGT